MIGQPLCDAADGIDVHAGDADTHLAADTGCTKAHFIDKALLQLVVIAGYRRQLSLQGRIGRFGYPFLCAFFIIQRETLLLSLFLALFYHRSIFCATTTCIFVIFCYH